VASRPHEPELRRRLPARVLVALTLAALVAGAVADGRAETAYEPDRGSEFFLLSDASVGSETVATVRFEGLGSAAADIVVYRVPEPIEFLKRQKNLHRVDVRGAYAGEGLANALSHLWTSWNRRARWAWQQLFAAPARRTMTAHAPELRQTRQAWRTTRERHPQFTPLPGFELVERFRYPVWQAKPIEPPRNTKLSGSSSEFVRPARGNVLVPIGKRAPGLYLVEAIVGGYRANTLVFVSDTVALTKVAADQLVVWTVDRTTGRAVRDVEVMWTDGVGTLAAGRTARDGTATLRHASPERTFVIGRDAAGGVFVSENFYFDSEIYDTKLYAFTDRPLYRPGEAVHVKLIGRHFQDARRSRAIDAGDAAVTIVDPSGTPAGTRTVRVAADAGAHTTFELPPNSLVGGYEIRIEYRGATYGAAFRVAEYVKPHFEISLVTATREFKTGQPVAATLVLRYPDGSPVKDATVQLVVKAQPLTMVEDELQYGGQYPVKVDTEELRVAADGTAPLTLPAVEHPSRYIVTMLASDGAAYRVRTTKEILVERGAQLYAITAPRRFTNPGERVTFSWQPRGDAAARPARWELVHLETQETRTGPLDGDAPRWSTTFAQAGSYTVTLRDTTGNVLGSTGHWVAGAGLQAAPGSIEIVFDRERYRPGDTARALITFSEPVQDALLTLERDRVERQALLSRGDQWLRLTRVGPMQWRADIRVRPEHAPNVTFSVLYARDGDYVFQNRGLRVEQESVTLALATDRDTYEPGERVTVDVTSTVGGRAAPAHVTVSVVDEMVYVLQPEIAPAIGDFFYHPRRNTVRTSSSLAFVSYDIALSHAGGPPARTSRNERATKVLERPRRDVVDTAAWVPDLRTDASGKARVTFTLPDSLTRWRITARAITADGVVGQRTASIASFKPLYLTWVGPRQFRRGDAPLVDVVAFNQTSAEASADFSASGKGLRTTRTLRLQPGPNHVSMSVAPAEAGVVTLELAQAGRVVDRLAVTVATAPAAWPGPRSLALDVDGKSTPLPLPADARDLRVSFVERGAGHFARIVDDLVGYPWGCVEQTASRLIPLSLAYQAMAGAPGRQQERIAQSLQTNRLRLVHMAGPDAIFPWWGPSTAQSSLMTAYAYYADWHASRALRVAVPADHWPRVLDAYRAHAGGEPLLHRALAVWFMGEIGLPTRTLVEGLVRDATALVAGAGTWRSVTASPLLAEPMPPLGVDLAAALVAHLAARAREPLRPEMTARVDAAREALRRSGVPLADALLLMTAGGATAAAVDAILARVRAEMPTFDRALTLVWLQQALGAVPASTPVAARLAGPWRESASAAGTAVWRLADGDARPASLDLADVPIRPLTAIVRYESAAAETHRLPVRVERTLSRLRPGAKPLEFALEPVAPGAALSSQALYVDEVRLSVEAGRRMRYGVLEVPLPPGADVERTTWGIQVKRRGSVSLEPVERARHEMGQLSYAVPVDLLEGSFTVRHLVRFSQRGRFELPPTRFFRMYEPDDKAFEDEGRSRRVVQVQ
jgi:uncharacterized protein YfaS (alpha-2-macroglobulin family)